MKKKEIPSTLYWENGSLFLLDQLELPNKVKYVQCKTYTDVINAIKQSVVMGTSAVAVASAYGVLLAGIKSAKLATSAKLVYLNKIAKEFNNLKPFNISLQSAISYMLSVAQESLKLNSQNFIAKLEEAAKNILDENISSNIAMGDFGARLLKKDSVVLTYSNAGSLATAGYGTALGVIRTAYKTGKLKKVLVSETRPALQGSKLTAWELQQEKIPFNLIQESAIAYMIKMQKIDAIVVGADKIVTNGDVVATAGTYMLSVLAKYHKIPFYVVAPSSVVDFSITYGSKIKLEEKSIEENLKVNGKEVAPKSTITSCYEFDITPSSNITMIITEKGVFKSNKISTLKKAK